MANVYTLLKWFGKIRSNRLRRIGVWTMYVCRKRYLGLFLDPVQACNLRCRMCYFSTPAARPVHGRIDMDEYRLMAHAIMHRVLKLQIGCGAEPTLCAHLPQMIAMAKEHGVPYVSITTNGQLLDLERLRTLAAAGLDELTLSAHGMCRPTYEWLMQRASFDTFMQLIGHIAMVQQEYPHLKLRINYTVNADNVCELSLYPQVFSQVRVDVLQVRPIQDLGDSDYTNFSMDKVLAHYQDIFPPLQEHCRTHGTTLLFPTEENLRALQGTQQQEGGQEEAQSSDEAYVYALPGMLWHKDFDYAHETFEAYCHRTHYGRHLLRSILTGRQKATHDQGGHTTRPLNYKVK